jgi:hypothetical protein
LEHNEKQIWSGTESRLKMSSTILKGILGCIGKASCLLEETPLTLEKTRFILSWCPSDVKLEELLVK